MWKLIGAPEHLTIDLDATLIGSHSEKEGAAGNFKGGYGFHPMLAYCDQTGEALAGELRSGNAGANTAADQIKVAEQAIGQIPVEHIESIKLLLRVDCAGSSHELLDWCRDGQIEFSVGYELNETVRSAILQIPDSDWVPALDQDGGPRPNGQVCEITASLDLAGWPAGSRVIVRRERAHPGAQLSFTDHDGHRFQAILTDRPGEIARLERDHRAPRKSRGSHPQRQGHRDAQLAVPRFRAQPRLACARADRPRPHRVDPAPAAHRRARQSRAQAPALPHPARRRAPLIPRTHSDAANTSKLALGQRAHDRVRSPQNPPLARWLTGRPSPRHSADARARGAQRSLSANGTPTAAGAPPSHRKTRKPDHPRRPRLAPHPSPSRQRSHQTAAARSGLTAAAFVLTGSAAVQAMVMLAYIVAGAVISARRRTQHVEERGSGESWREIVCLVVAGLVVYLGSRFVVRFALGPWFTWWLAIGSGVVIFRRWQSLRAR